MTEPFANLPPVDMTPPRASDGELKRVAQLAARWVETRATVTDLEARLKTAKEAHRKVAEEELPDAMNQAGLKEFETLDGYQVAVQPVVSASWPSAEHPDRIERAVAFLKGAEALDLVTCEVVCAFSKREQEAAVEIYERLRGDNRAKVELKQRVHPQTLSAFVRARLREGKSVDMDALSVSTFMRATVKR